MTYESSNHATLSDGEVLSEVHRLAGRERDATARLIAMLGELDARRLYLGEGCSSLFTYCTAVLHLSEHAAYGRIEAARAARKWPVVLDLLASGALHLTAITLLSRHLTPDNHQELLAAARNKSKREVEEIVAALRPQPPVPSTVRKLLAAPVVSSPVRENLEAPQDRDVTREVASPQHPVVPPRRAEIKPLAPERYKIQFTASRETYDRLRQAQDLLRHQVPNGDVAVIVDRALTLLLAELHKTKHAAVTRPQAPRSGGARSRHIPAGVKRAVWDRDRGQCAFIGTNGRCGDRGFLEYHHVVPFADGGATSVDNLELRCRAHNAYEVKRWFGPNEADTVREVRATYGARRSDRSWPARPRNVRCADGPLLRDSGG